MKYIKIIKIFCIRLKIITLFFSFSLIFFNSCNFLKKIEKQENDITIKWDDEEANKSKEKIISENEKTKIDKSKKPEKSINTDSIEGSGTDYFANYTELFGYELTGDENPNLVDEIATWLGTKYKYGGSSHEGTDCSGFVGNVYKNVYGIKLSRSSKDMINDVIIVEKEEITSGDLIFFKINGKTISHVGIYISRNKFAHASNKRGVVINDLNENYYLERFYKAGRVKK